MLEGVKGYLCRLNWVKVSVYLSTILIVINLYIFFCIEHGAYYVERYSIPISLGIAGFFLTIWDWAWEPMQELTQESTKQLLTDNKAETQNERKIIF